MRTLILCLLIALSFAAIMQTNKAVSTNSSATQSGANKPTASSAPKNSTNTSAPKNSTNSSASKNVTNSSTSTSKNSSNSTSNSASAATSNKSNSSNSSNSEKQPKKENTVCKVGSQIGAIEGYVLKEIESSLIMKNISKKLLLLYCQTTYFQQNTVGKFNEIASKSLLIYATDQGLFEIDLDYIKGILINKRYQIISPATASEIRSAL